MGSGEENVPAKSTKPPAATQELPTTPSYLDWASPMQAYYGAGATPPPFFTSTVASSPPPPHPYLWGGQPLMPPYGTPPLSYPGLYPHGGIFTHPPMTPGMATPTVETGGKPPDVKDKNSAKKLKGNSGNQGLVNGRSGDSGKVASDSGNEGASQSGESGSEDSSDASDQNANQHDFSANKKGSFNQMLADGANAQNNNAAAQYSGAAVESAFLARGQPTASLPVLVPGKPAVPVPATNLNIGMDLWNSTSAGSVPIKTRPAVASGSPAVVPAPMAGREGVVPDQTWISDERELKRQRRKQSNRESARRSRLRKQAECEDLAAKVQTLTKENQTLRSELQQLAEECEKLSSENASIVEQLTRIYGQEAIPTEIGNVNTVAFQSIGSEGNVHVHDNSRGSNSVSGKKNDKYSSSNGKHESGCN